MSAYRLGKANISYFELDRTAFACLKKKVSRQLLVKALFVLHLLSRPIHTDISHTEQPDLLQMSEIIIFCVQKSLCARNLFQTELRYLC